MLVQVLGGLELAQAPLQLALGTLLLVVLLGQPLLVLALVLAVAQGPTPCQA